MVVMRSRNSCRTLGAPRDGRYPIDVRPRSCEAAERYCTRIIIAGRYQSSASSTAPPLRGFAVARFHRCQSLYIPICCARYARSLIRPPSCLTHVL